MKKTERQIINLKKELLNIKKKEENSTMEKKVDKYGNKVSMFEHLK